MEIEPGATALGSVALIINLLCGWQADRSLTTFELDQRDGIESAKQLTHNNFARIREPRR
ncbi:MAG TPA: hypothetical protein VF088_07165 [Pyrinomonadaceae bacterium]